ncbi:MAG: AEC family transporter [Thermotogota bacterium]
MTDWGGIFTHSFTSIIPVFSIFITGYIFGKVFKDKSVMLSKLAFYLFGNVLIFTYITEHVPTLDMIWRYFLGTLIVTFTIVIVYWVFGKIVKKNMILWSYTNSFSNTGYIGYPVLEYSIGPQAIPLAVIMASANMVLLPIIGTTMLSTKGKGLVKKGLINIIKIPWLYTVIISWILGTLGFNWLEDLPTPAVNYVTMLKDSSIPVILLVVGVNLSRIPVRLKHLFNILPASLMKLFLPPALALIVGKMMGMEGLVFQIFVLELAMPTAVNTAILAEGLSETNSHEKEKEFASAVVVYSTFLFLFSYPIWFSIVSGGM